MKNKNIFSRNIIVFCCFLFVISCTNTKNQFLYRKWHNMNARYNGFFYSREYFKESVTKVEKANKNDFTRILPLFIYTDNQTAKNYYSDFDKTIKKSSTVIQRHAIINPKSKEEIANACKWVDENYMLIGESHLYKRDMFSALEVFEYVSKKYPNPEAKYYAMLWLIRTHNEIGSLSKSEPIIDEVRNAKDFPKDKFFQCEFALVSADYYIRRESYSDAIMPLTKAIGLTKNKATKARYTYILAQLYEKISDNINASKYFQMVPGLHPGYDMAFSAQMKRATLYEIQSGDSKAIKKQLMKMLKDEKNAEFRDQIYYALAEISDKENDSPQAIAYLDKSIRESVSNKTQKALSYLKRADIYFAATNYKSAESNYDSAIAILPKDYPNYYVIEGKKKSLNQLVFNLTIISTEDSLQRLAKLGEKERNKAIDNIIDKIEEEEKRKEEERQEQLKNPTPVAQTPSGNSGQSASSGAWYFYNSATVTYGIGEFNKKWGMRKLEDNWRRSEKEQVLATNANTEEETTVDSTEVKETASAEKDKDKNKKDRNYYLKKIPVTNEALTKSNLKIVDAYYNVGSIYKEQLLNLIKSIETFEELLKRFPDNKYKLPCYYQLYRIYLSMGNTDKSNYYKNILLNDYPDSEYAKIIKSPQYAKDVMASKSKVEKFYAETYQLYSEGKYNPALANCLTADSTFSKSYLMPQFDFVKALCIGRTQDINAFEKALTQVVINYPKEPLKDKAQEILDLIRKQKMVPTAKDTTSAKMDTAQLKPKFIFKDDGDYYWVTTIVNGKGDINKFKSKISDMNDDSFSTEELLISSIFLDINHQLVSIKNFNGKTKAMNYYNFFKDKKAVFADLEEGSYQSFIISSENYAVFYKDKNIADYQEFFTQNFK